jgi:hypothetical protein
MTKIKFYRDTYRGTAEGDHGVFTSSDGVVYEGQIAGDAACVGVRTDTNGNTFFVECDADGDPHGRALDCWTDGTTWYLRYEHGSLKEEAILWAKGTWKGPTVEDETHPTCTYKREACRADYAPFAALKAMVLPIKARPPLLWLPQPSLRHIFPSHRPPSRSNRPLFWHSQELATTHADKVRTCRLRHQPAWALRHSNLPNKCTARPTWTTHRR